MVVVVIVVDVVKFSPEQFEEPEKQPEQVLSVSLQEVRMIQVKALNHVLSCQVKKLHNAVSKHKSWQSTSSITPGTASITLS